jgi:hypothetical protein
MAMSLGTFVISAQAQDQNPDQVYGYDPLLYNGKVYSFYPVRGTGGTQYLFDTFDSLGSITVRGVTYTNLTLNYDIYNQLLILKYKNAIGSQSLVEISYAWLEKVYLWGSNFETFTEHNLDKCLYQVIGKGDEKIMYYLSKELLIDNLKSSKNHYFSSGRKEMFLNRDGQLISFKNNNSFLKAFNLSDQTFIKAYLRSQKINVKTASDIIMTDLINYCNRLSGS